MVMNLEKTPYSLLLCVYVCASERAETAQTDLHHPC